jgi:hypothetical protein
VQRLLRQVSSQSVARGSHEKPRRIQTLLLRSVRKDFQRTVDVKSSPTSSHGRQALPLQSLRQIVHSTRWPQLPQEEPRGGSSSIFCLVNDNNNNDDAFSSAISSDPVWRCCLSDVSSPFVRPPQVIVLALVLTVLLLNVLNFRRLLLLHGKSNDVNQPNGFFSRRHTPANTSFVCDDLYSTDVYNGQHVDGFSSVGHRRRRRG